MPVTLYKLNGSPPARAVMMTLEALGVPDVEYVDVNLLTQDNLQEEYLKMNPQHTIPTLKDSDGFVIWDSHAICTYLVSKYGETDELYPADIKKRAIIDQRLHFDSGILFPAVSGTVGPVLFKGESAFNPDYREKITTAYDFTEKFLTSTWLAGEEFTLADICCAASISSLNVLLPIDENVYPKLSSWLNRCAAKDFYKTRNLPGLEQFGQLLKSKLA